MSASIIAKQNDAFRRGSLDFKGERVFSSSWAE